MSLVVTHTGIIKIVNGKIMAVVYYPSKFERKIGDKITYDGISGVVAVIGKSRNEVIDELNGFIKRANKGEFITL